MRKHAGVTIKIGRQYVQETVRLLVQMPGNARIRRCVKRVRYLANLVMAVP